ncbi:hypothetical protein GGI24_001254 [Coemansia furcata]|nr:hypothetical protein GGI24_001254 [Coemansia furcata]
MVYADLVSLKLRVDEGVPYDITWRAINDVESFPVLSILDVRGGYPFGDDLLFRGNGETLQNLQLPFSALCRNALGRFDVLKRSGVTRMNSIRIGKIYEEDEGFLTANPDVLIEKQVHRILEVASSLVLLNDTKARHLLNSLCSAPNTATLEYLEFGTLNFYANGVFNIIAALPSLLSLECRVDCYGPTIEKIPVSERPSTLYAERYPLSHNFRALKATYFAKASARDMAHVAMLLMVVCPSLKTVDVIPSLRNEFSREIAWSMINAIYKPYADRLKTLIHLE